MKYLIKTNKIQLNENQTRIQKGLGISNTMFQLLLGRGMRENEMESFLHPSMHELNSPFDIDGMYLVKERILKAINNKEKIMIYGDYDCDGICAISILTLFLKNKTDVSFYIPDRSKDGYGLNKDSIDKILARNSYDLFITVDCGITSYEEVEYLKSKGIDVIITDHHEPQEKIPNCFVCDPKISKMGFYDLCGAGVALKIVQAIAGLEESMKYFDIAAIATIADVVPLKNDNRIIAYYGIKQLNKNPRKGIKLLYGEDKFTSGNIMFKLAPKINAAGRLHSALKVVDLFVEDDYFLLKTLADELQRDNTTRQDLCEKVASDAFNMLKGVDFNDNRIIILYNPNWEPGVLGIAAARLVEEFKRPTILFSINNDGELRGSARSIKAVNMFNLLSSLSSYFTSFGGHAQAAGINMKEENFEAFKKAANDYLFDMYDDTDFIEELSCEMELPLNMDFLSFAKELEMLEPTGYSNPKPSFKIDLKNARFEQIGFSQHMKYSLSNLSFVAFSKYNKALSPKISDLSLEVNLGLNSFMNVTSVQAVVQSTIINSLNITDDECTCLNMHHFDYFGLANINSIGFEDINTLLTKHFGTLFVCFNEKEYKELLSKIPKIKSLPLIFATAKVLNPENAVVLCPSETFNYGYYNNVIIVGKPLTNGYLKYIQDSSHNVYSYGNIAKSTFKVSDDMLRNLYKELYSVSLNRYKIQNPYKLYLSVCSRCKLSYSEFTFGFMVLKQLDLVSINEKGLLVVVRKQTNLNDSKAYFNMNN